MLDAQNVQNVKNVLFIICKVHPCPVRALGPGLQNNFSRFQLSASFETHLLRETKLGTLLCCAALPHSFFSSFSFPVALLSHIIVDR